MVKYEANPIIKVKQKTNVDVDINVSVNIDLKRYLPQIRNELNKLKKGIKNLNPELESKLDEIQNRIDVKNLHPSSKVVTP